MPPSISSNTTEMSSATEQQHYAAIQLQKLNRGFKVRKQYNSSKETNKNRGQPAEPNPDKENQQQLAAIKLQKLERGRTARKLHSSRVVTRKQCSSQPTIEPLDSEDADQQHHAALQLQKIERGRRAREGVRDKKRQSRMQVASCLPVEVDAATNSCASDCHSVALPVSRNPLGSEEESLLLLSPAERAERKWQNKKKNAAALELRAHMARMDNAARVSYYCCG